MPAPVAPTSSTATTSPTPATCTPARPLLVGAIGLPAGGRSACPAGYPTASTATGSRLADHPPAPAVWIDPNRPGPTDRPGRCRAASAAGATSTVTALGRSRSPRRWRCAPGSTGAAPRSPCRPAGARRARRRQRRGGRHSEWVQAGHADAPSTRSRRGRRWDDRLCSVRRTLV